MRPDEILKAVADDLARFAQSRPGARSRVQVATDPWHVLELLAAGPAGMLIVVHWAGDTNLSTDMPEIALPEHSIEVLVGHNLGLTVDPGRVLTQGTAERPGLLQFLWDVRARVRAMMLDPAQTSTIFEYRSTEPVTLPSGMPLAAYRMRFAITVSDDEPGLEPDWTQVN